MALNGRQWRTLVSNYATVTVPPHQLGGSGLLQHNGTFKCVHSEEKESYSVSFLQKANRLESLEPLTVLTGAALNGPLSFPWNLAVSEALLSSISCLSAGGFEERGPALGGTLADCLSLSHPPCLSFSDRSAVTKDDIIPLPLGPRVLKTTPSVCVHLCKGCDASSFIAEKGNVHQQISAEVSHKQTKDVPPKAGSSIRSLCGSGSRCSKWNEADNL